MNRILMVLIALLGLGAQAWAQDAIGVVKTVSGEAIVIDADKPVAARAGTPVRLGSVLKTGPKGSMGPVFSTLPSLTPSCRSVRTRKSRSMSICMPRAGVT